MGNRLLVLRYLLIFSLVLSICSPFLQAQTPPSTPKSPAFSQALKALGKSDFKEALAHIEEAISQDPSNPDYQYVLGVIDIQLRRFADAEAIFLKLLETDRERFKSVYFDLANVYAQQGKEEKVLEMLDNASEADPGRAEFEKGLAYMRLNRQKEALEHFRRGALLKPEIAPEATVQEGLANFQLKKFKEAEKLFKKALTMNLPPKRVTEVKKMIEANEKAIYANKPWQITASTGFQYNNNLFSSPLEAVNIGDQRIATGQDDVINFTSLAGRYYFYQEDPWKAGATYSQLFATYVDHSELNLIGMRPSLFVQWEKNPYFAGLEYAYNFFFVNGQPDTQVHSIIPRFTMLHGNRFRTELASGVDWRITKDGVLDSNHYFGSVTESYLMLEGKAHVRVGYALSRDDFVSNQPDDLIHDLMIGTQWPIWKDRWFFDIAGLYTFRNFDFDPNLNNERRDDEKNLIVQVFGQLTPYLQLAFGYQHTWNDSNIVNVVPGTSQNFDPFSFTRSVYTCILTYNY